MKRIIFFLTFVVITLYGMAQKLDFDGILVDQNLNTFEAALLRVGATRQTEYEKPFMPNDHIYFYSHLGMRCALYVQFDDAGKISEVMAEYGGANDVADKVLLNQLSSVLRLIYPNVKCFEGKAPESIATIVFDPTVWEFDDGVIFVNRMILPPTSANDQENRFIRVRYIVGKNMNVSSWPNCNDLSYNNYVQLAVEYITWSGDYEKAKQITRQWCRKTPYGALVNAYTNREPLEDLNYAIDHFTTADGVGLRKAYALRAYYYMINKKSDYFERDLINAVRADIHFDEDIAGCLSMIYKRNPKFLEKLKIESKKAGQSHFNKYISYLTTGKKPQNEPYEEIEIAQFKVKHWLATRQ